MDTKLKNRHKLAIFLIILAIAIPALIVGSGYNQFLEGIEEGSEQNREEYLCSESFLNLFVESGYALYNDRADQPQELLKDFFSPVFEAYGMLYPYMDYQVTDENGKALDTSFTDSARELTEAELVNYELGIIIKYDENGIPTVKVISDGDESRQTSMLRTLVNSQEYEKRYTEDSEGNEVEVILETPQNRTFVYALTGEQLDEYMRMVGTVSYGSYRITNTLVYELLVLILIVGVAAIVLPQWKSLRTGGEKIFRVPLEVPLLSAIIVASYMGTEAGYIITRNNGNSGFLDFALWSIVFAVVYWLTGCLRWGTQTGMRGYLKEHTLTYRLWVKIKEEFPVIKKWGGRQLGRIYHSLEEIDLEDKGNKIIFKILLINFLILLVLCTLWFYGVLGLIVYSVVLFFILRKYYNDLKDKYRLLLKATNEIADGNLDVEIQGELGVFEPFRTEIEKIQSGFKKAVDEEVKSQKMKTELITNVSHDLKTPLTAIITYVNLLKEEKDEEKRKDYIDVLERKSLRLKVLIEDLFEISKASSENVTLELIKVDIVNLFKQVKLELDDKIQASGLDFRMSFPEEKLILTLDSQKTYRIFENLIANITKYAMPHTRVYIEMTQEGQEAVIRMKNVSAAELNFSPEEITERFVRGDVSRNTEGSGLGLAIAKSFTELQGGTFRIETDADLFKVEIRWGIK